MKVETIKPSLTLLALLLLCLSFGAVVVKADELHLRDGTVIKADEVWERNDEIWYRQGQVIRSIPASEVMRGQTLTKVSATATSTITTPHNRTRRRVIVPTENSTSANDGAPTAFANTIAVNSQTKPVTRIIFKDGVHIDADASWEMGDRIGYRLGAIQAFIDKDAVAQILKDFVPSATQSLQPSEPQPFRFTTKHAGLDQLILTNAARHGVDPLLIFLVMQQESGFNHRAVSRAGARGLMQLMPGTAAQLGVRNIHDPVENVEAGTRYLKMLLQRFNGDVNLALAGYNAGEEAVVRYGYRVPPYRETINYVRRIGWTYQQYKK